MIDKRLEILDELIKTGEIAVEDYVSDTKYKRRADLTNEITTLRRLCNVQITSVRHRRKVIGYRVKPSEKHRLRAKLNQLLPKNAPKPIPIERLNYKSLEGKSGAYKAIYAKIAPYLQDDRIADHTLDHVNNKAVLRQILLDEGYVRNETFTAWKKSSIQTKARRRQPTGLQSINRNAI